MAISNIKSKEEYERELHSIEAALNTLETIKEQSKNQEDNTSFPWTLREYAIEEEIEKLTNKAKNLVRQFNCSHENTTGMRYVGHDSHKDHYENKCEDCGLVLEWDMY